jgi:hypothetical protein
MEAYIDHVLPILSLREKLIDMSGNSTAMSTANTASSSPSVTITVKPIDHIARHRESNVYLLPSDEIEAQRSATST